MKEDILIYSTAIILALLVTSLIMFNQFLSIELIVLLIVSILYYLFKDSFISKIALVLNLIVILFILKVILSTHFVAYSVFLNNVKLSKVTKLNTNYIQSVCVLSSNNYATAQIKLSNLTYYVFAMSCSNKMCCKAINLIVPEKKILVNSDSKSYLVYLKNSTQINYQQFYTRVQENNYRYTLYKYFPYVCLLLSVFVLVTFLSLSF